MNVNQNARNKIVTFQENKFPMASVDGELVSTDMTEMSYDGVKAIFSPFKHNTLLTYQEDRLSQQKALSSQ